MKTCSKCKENKQLDEFNKKGSGKQPWCRECNRVRSRQYYADNREHHKKVTRLRAKQDICRNQQYIISYLIDRSCVECGEDDIVVLEFDHVRGKTANISNAVGNGWSIRRLEAELVRCEVVCANCHRRRTAQRGNFYKHGGVANAGLAADF